MDDAAAAGSADSSIAELASSARGWHGVQLAVLAFIGLCGVLSDRDATLPRWLQIASGLLAIAALALACLSIFLVASVAWPFPSRAAKPRAGLTHRLRTGITLTYLAVAVMALAASSGWWPTKSSADDAPEGAGGATVEITDSAGNTACGELVAGPAGRLRLATDEGTVELATAALASIEPVASC